MVDSQNSLRLVTYLFIFSLVFTSLVESWLYYYAGKGQKSHKMGMRTVGEESEMVENGTQWHNKKEANNEQ